MPRIKVPQNDWCQCQDWRAYQEYFLANHAKMNFCVFCGSKLVKTKELDSDTEFSDESFLMLRQGYYYVPRLAEPEHLTVFHVVKEGRHTFLCGMQKPVGAQPPPDIPHRDRCCRDCLRVLRETPVYPGGPGTEEAEVDHAKGD